MLWTKCEKNQSDHLHRAKVKENWKSNFLLQRKSLVNLLCPCWRLRISFHVLQRHSIQNWFIFQSTAASLPCILCSGPEERWDCPASPSCMEITRPVLVLALTLVDEVHSIIMMCFGACHCSFNIIIITFCMRKEACTHWAPSVVSGHWWMRETQPADRLRH